MLKFEWQVTKNKKKLERKAPIIPHVKKTLKVTLLTGIKRIKKKS